MLFTTLTDASMLEWKCYAASWLAGCSAYHSMYCTVQDVIENAHDLEEQSLFNGHHQGCCVVAPQLEHRGNIVSTRSAPSEGFRHPHSCYSWERLPG